MKSRILDKSITIFFLHILAWACFLLYPFITGMPFREDIFIKIFLNTCLLAAFFYVNTTFLIPKLLTQGKVTVYFLIIGLIMAALLGANIFFNHFLDFDYSSVQEHARSRNFRAKNHGFGIRRIVRPLLSAMFIFAVSTSYKLLSDWFKNEREKKELENQNLVSELSFLKSQVSPHFIFNTLNNIYSLSLNNSALTSDAILRLSQLLRYMLYESDGRKVELKKEIEYLEDFIELQKMRLRPEIKIIFLKHGDFNNKFIEPMLLIPFVENAFKHGIHDSGNSDIVIDVNFIGKELHLKVVNSINANKANDEASGIGLQNVKRRLELLYPEQHMLLIKEQDAQYLVELILCIK